MKKQALNYDEFDLWKRFKIFVLRQIDYFKNLEEKGEFDPLEFYSEV